MSIEALSRYKPALTYEFITHVRRTHEAAMARNLAGLPTLQAIQSQAREIERSIEALAECRRLLDVWDNGAAADIHRLALSTEEGKQTLHHELVVFRRTVALQKCATIDLLAALDRELVQLQQAAMRVVGR